MRVFAPAKVNLALHVTGRRADGYHLLDSLVVFADIGDWLDIAPASELRLSVTGPRAGGVPVDRRNLVWRAVESLGPGPGVAITLDKHLPMAGGIGGGSSDAAAALRGVSALWSRPLPETATLLAIGADLPVCVAARPARMRGIGEVLDPLPDLPPIWMVLANPGIEVPTGAVFGALDTVDHAPLPRPAWHDAESLFDWLAGTRNDLEDAAVSQVPQVGAVLDALRADPACRLARMSGSGGTCYGLYLTQDGAQAAADRLGHAHSDWWVAAARVLDVPP